MTRHIDNDLKIKRGPRRKGERIHTLVCMYILFILFKIVLKHAKMSKRAK